MNNVAGAAENKNNNPEFTTEKAVERFLFDGNSQLPEIEMRVSPDDAYKIYANKKAGLFGFHPRDTELLTRPPKNYLELSAASIANDIRKKTDESHPLIAFGEDSLVYSAPKGSDLRVIHVSDETNTFTDLSDDQSPDIGVLTPQHGDRVYILDKAAADNLLQADDKDNVLGDIIDQGSPYFAAVFETDATENMQRHRLRNHLAQIAAKNRIGIASQPNKPSIHQPATTPIDRTRNTTPAEENFDTFREMGLKQLAREIARDRLSGTSNGDLEAWAMRNIVIPRATLEAAPESQKTIEQQRNEQITTFQTNVDYFVAKLSDEPSVDHTDDTEPEMLVFDEEESVKPIQTLTQRFQKISRWFKDRKAVKAERSGALDSSTIQRRAVGVTALIADRNDRPTPDSDKFGDLARNWHDIFDHMNTADYRDVEMHEIRKEIGPELEKRGEAYYKGAGVWEINPLNPPVITEVVKMIEELTSKAQPPLAHRTSTSSFKYVKNSSAEQTE